MKKLMILGAGIYQVPLIQKAKEMGLYTIVVSIPGNYPGFCYADKCYYVNTVDTDAVLQVAVKEHIDGIITTGTDVAVKSIGRVCDELGLKGISFKAAKIACDKAKMKKVFLDNGVQTAEYHHVSVQTSYDDILMKCDQWGYPLIFKPVDSSGSRGMKIVTDSSQIYDAIKTVLKVTKQDEFIIESYLDGTEFGAQAYVQDGNLEFVLPHGDYIFMGSTGVPAGHYAPFPLTGLEAEIYEQTKLAISAMGIDNCAINADFMLYHGKAYVLELGARCGATCLAELVSLYYGYDYYEKMISCALGEKVNFSPSNLQRVPNASHILMSDYEGVIEEIKNYNHVNKNLVEVHFDYKPGDHVRKFRVGPDRIGHVIVTGDTLEQAETNLKIALDNIYIKVKEC